MIFIIMKFVHNYGDIVNVILLYLARESYTLEPSGV